MTQINIVYSGMVQGVGFRYAVCSLARQFGLKGSVRNLTDGRVEMVVEGNLSEIERLCQGIEGHFQGYVKNKEVTQTPAQGRFKDFQIIL